jgi:hypothetical protein
MRRIGLVIALLAIVVSQAVGVGPAGALTTTYTGAINAADPTMPVVAISTPTCTTQLVTPVHYEVTELDDIITGTHTFTLTSTPDGFASIYIYENSFDPNDGVTNCIAASNAADPIVLTLELTEGTTYFVVVFDDQFTQVGGDYELVVESPDPPPTTTTSTTSTTIATTTTTEAPQATAAPAGVTRPRFTG